MWLVHSYSKACWWTLDWNSNGWGHVYHECGSNHWKSYLTKIKHTSVSYVCILLIFLPFWWLNMPRPLHNPCDLGIPILSHNIPKHLHLLQALFQSMRIRWNYFLCFLRGKGGHRVVARVFYFKSTATLCSKRSDLQISNPLNDNTNNQELTTSYRLKHYLFHLLT